MSVGQSSLQVLDLEKRVDRRLKAHLNLDFLRLPIEVSLPCKCNTLPSMRHRRLQVLIRYWLLHHNNHINGTSPSKRPRTLHPQVIQQGPTHNVIFCLPPPEVQLQVCSQEDVEKSKMLRSVQYNHFDPTLVYRRQPCERALERYNAAYKLDSGVTEQEVINLLLKVVDSSQDTTHKFPFQNHSKGRIGLGVKIETPFTCTYGYNLKIQDNVYVGKGCTFDDAGVVEIGPRTIIAPGVTILTTDYGKDLAHQKGTKDFWIAGDVIIASGVVIGAKGVIYPGVRIGEGATVEQALCC